MGTRILIIEDDELLAATFQRFLLGAGYGVDVAGDYVGGKDLLTDGSYDVVFMDINLRGKQTGIDLLRDIRKINLEIPVVIITGFPEVGTAAEAVRNSAFDYLCKPIEKEQLLQIAMAAVRHKILKDEKENYQRKLETAFRSVRDTIDTVDLDMTVAGQSEAAEVLAGVGRQVRPQAVLSLTSRALSLPEAAVNQKALLSEREQQILTMLGHGESNSDIAAAFDIGLRTVETYYARIIDKLNLGGMKELRRYVKRNNPH